MFRDMPYFVESWRTFRFRMNDGLSLEPLFKIWGNSDRDTQDIYLHRR